MTVCKEMNDADMIAGLDDGAVFNCTITQLGRAARQFQGCIVARKLETRQVKLDGMAQEPAGYWQTWRKPVNVEDLINVEPGFIANRKKEDACNK